MNTAHDHTHDPSDRYARHRQIQGLSQQALSDAHVIVLGAGATGNELLKNLALLGIGTVEVFDRDTIEGHNLTRSVLFRDTDIAASKVEVAAARARELDPNLTVIAHHGDLYETLTLDRILAADCVIIGLDAMEPRLRVNQLCLLAGVPLINTAIDHRSVRVSWHPFHQQSSHPSHPEQDDDHATPASREERRPESAADSAVGISCFACNLSPNVYDNLASRYSCGSLRKELATDGLIPTTIITSSIAASMAVSLVVQVLHDEAPKTSWIWNLDTKTGKVREYAGQKDPLCPYCFDPPSKRILIPWSSQSRSSVVALFDSSAPSQPVIPEPQKLHLALLDPLIDTVTCPACHGAEPSERVHRTPSYQWTDRLMICPTCGNGAREVSRITALTADDAAYFCEHPEQAPLVAFGTMTANTKPDERSETSTLIIYRKATNHE